MGNVGLGDGEWIRAPRVSAEFSIPVGTLRQWTSQRRIPFTRIGRAVYYHRETLRRFFEAHSVPVNECIGPDGRRPS